MKAQTLRKQSNIKPKYNDEAIPAKAGISLRSRHYREFIDSKPDVAWLEVHSENFFAKGGMPIYLLEQIREHYPLSFHGVGLSLGTAGKLDKTHLQKLKNLVERFNPHLVSEHISWSNIGGTFLNDLLPLPYTQEALGYLVDNIKHVQDTLGRQILVENPSTYLEFNESEMPEWEFINKTIEKSGCGLLLDINNVYVSCKNNNLNAYEYIDNIEYNKVQEIHLAGHEIKTIRESQIIIDTHGDKVSKEVWDLYKKIIKNSGKIPTLIEWDTNVPELGILLEEASKAQKILDQAEVQNAAA